MDTPGTVTIFQVDSFADQPFKGNPAGVCILEKPLDDAMMQNIAAEMNLSETAFAVPISPGGIASAFKFRLRWFTPACEVDLCGHATLATAKILYDIFEVKHETIAFDSRSGELRVRRDGEFIQLDFPAGDPQPVKLPDYYSNALGRFRADLAEKIIAAHKCARTGILLVHLDNPDEVKKLSPDYADLLQAEDSFGTKGVCVTAAGEKPYDFISRFFAPCYGINEDPVTGAAHTVLAPYWHALLNKRKMNAFQASARGGEVIVEIREETAGHRRRVLISGKAVIVMEAVMKLIPA
jgi:PhzF family phenazine biosynthesis protein